MNARQVKNHYFSRFADGRTCIGLEFTDNSSHVITAQNHIDAMMMLDVLRNEGPVFMNEHAALYTGSAPVGAP